MSTGRSILFFAEKKSPMVKFIQKTIREINTELYPKFEPRIIKRGQFACQAAAESYIFGAWFFPDGEDFEYFGGKEVFEKKFKDYNKKYKLWFTMGGSNTTYKDKGTGQESVYPLYYFRLLMDEINKSGIENDVLLTCITDASGYAHKTYPKVIREKWTGKFL